MSKRAKKEKRPVAKIDFKPYGAAIKAGRTKQKESRNKAADALFISPRYLANIENKGQHPSVQVFLELMSHWRPAEIASKGPARKANCGAKEKAITEFFQILYTEQ